MSGGIQYKVRVAEAEAVTPTIRRLRLVAIDGTRLPPYSAGSHTVLSFGRDGRLFRNP